MDDTISCSECGSFAVEQTTQEDEEGLCEYRCQDCGEYFVDSFMTLSGEAKQYLKEYEKSLVNHIAWVQSAGKIIGVSDDQLSIHDQSKWTDEEFYAYAKHFNGGGAPDKFAFAWLHHIHHNPHHWQHWIFSDGFTPKASKLVENGVLPMPEKYILEMIADWLGASREYTGSWNMADWLNDHLDPMKPKIILHPETKNLLDEILASIGYWTNCDNAPLYCMIENKFKHLG